MKVLYLLNSTIMDGSTISFINMIKGLHRKGVKCYVVAPDMKMDPAFQKSVEGQIEKYYFAHLHSHTRDDISFYHGVQKIKKIVRNILYNNIFSIKYFTSRENEELARIIQEVKPDLIHTNVGVIQVGYQAAKKYNLPHLWHLREYQTRDFHWVIEPSYNAFVKMIHDSYVITITKGVLQYFQLDGSHKAKYMYDGCLSIDETLFDFPKENYFLCCSRISEEKGHREAVKAFALFHQKHPEYRLVIAGFGIDRFIQELKEMAIKGKCLDAIDFIGYQSDIKPVMSKARALIVASPFEGLGRMTAEAAFCGCLVIGHNTAGTKEILDITGGFPYTGGAENLEKKMCEVAVLSEDQYKKHAEYAQKQAIAHFSNEVYVEKMYDIYKRICEHRVLND